ncbi:hypothetical protein [Spirochaeta dissipatitropha]
MSGKDEISADLPGVPGEKKLSEQRAQVIIRRAIELQHAADQASMSSHDQQNQEDRRHDAGADGSGMDVGIIKAAAMEAGVEAGKFRIALAESELLQYTGRTPEDRLRSAESYLGSRERCIVHTAVINGAAELVYNSLIDLFKNEIYGLNISGVSDVPDDAGEKPLIAVSLDSSAVWSLESAKKLEYANGLWYGDVKEFLVVVESQAENRTAVTLYAPLERSLSLNSKIGKWLAAVLSPAAAVAIFALSSSAGLALPAAAGTALVTSLAGWFLLRKGIRSLYKWGVSKSRASLRKILNQLELNLRIP